MSEGLRPHWCQYFLYDIKHYYDVHKHCMVKKVTYRCMICGKEYHERYEYKPPPKKKSNKVLQKNKRKYGNRY